MTLDCSISFPCILTNEAKILSVCELTEVPVHKSSEENMANVSAAEQEYISILALGYMAC